MSDEAEEVGGGVFGYGKQKSMLFFPVTVGQIHLVCLIQQSKHQMKFKLFKASILKYPVINKLSLYLTL